MIKLEFTLEEINKVLSGLLELPAKISMELYLKIQKDAQYQVNLFDNKKSVVKK